MSYIFNPFYSLLTPCITSLTPPILSLPRLISLTPSPYPMYYISLLELD